MDTYDKDKKKKVRRLVDVDVSHVSLVDRPANQTPFKFIKRDGTETEKGKKPMNITLKNMFGSRNPEVTSVIADTRAKAEAVAKMLLEGDKAELTEQDGLFIVRKSGATATPDEKVIHLGKSAGVAYTVANLTKELALYDMDSENFDDALKSEGFIPGLFIGMDALHNTIRSIAMSDDTKSPADMQAKVATAMADFQKYVDSMIGALPEKAFKFEKAMMAVTPQGTTPLHFTPEGFSAEVHDAVFGGDAPDPSKTMTDGDAGKDGEGADKGAETPAAAAPAADAPKAADAAETPAPAADAAPAKPANLEELPAGTPETKGASAEDIASAVIDAVTKSMGTQIATAMKPLADRLDAQDAAVGKLTKAVGGAVATTPDADDDNVVQLSKGDNAGGGVPPLMDTAYNVKRG